MVGLAASLPLPLPAWARLLDRLGMWPTRTVGWEADSGGWSMTREAEAEFQELFEAHYARLVRVLTAATGDREQAADCVQEAFVRAHLHWRKVRAYGDPAGWIRRVAINLAHDQARRSARGRKATERLGAQTQAGADPVDQPIDLVGSLDSLPPQQRMAMALHYVEGLGVAEVADAMGVSEGAVKYHLHEGRERLRRVVADRKRGWQ